MKHFSAEEWIDFVNHMTASDETASMQKHLDGGCVRCLETMALWQKVKKTAAPESPYQPPAGTVRVAKTAFANNGFADRQKKNSSVIEVLFDSFLQPALCGARSAGFGTRQMLYRADPYQIDVQIEVKTEGKGLLVTGQLLDISHPEIVGRDVHVTLSNRRGHVVHTLTNQYGEFRGEIENSGDLQLSFPTATEKPIVISLRDALGRLPGGRL
jgi:hypothetical protein